MKALGINVDTKCGTTYNVSKRYSECQEMNAPKGGSSHYIFRKLGCQPITIPKHEPVKKVYVELVKLIVESEANNDEGA